MGIAAVQVYLARLYTERSLREEFFAEPMTSARAAGLGPADAAMLAQVSSAQVRFFARSLQRKRLGEVAKLLPASCAALGDRFAPLFFCHADTYVPSGTGKYVDDARAFAAYLIRHAGDADPTPFWIIDVVRYEAAWLTAARVWPGIRVLVFRHALPELLHVRREWSRLAGAPARPCVAVWWRPWPGATLQHRMWRLPRLAWWARANQGLGRSAGL